MTLPAWPSDLPRPTRRGYSARGQDGRRRRSFETGPPSYAGRFSSRARQVALEVIVTRAQKAVFDQFVDETTAGGSLPFTMPDPMTDGWALLDADGAPILDGDGTPILLSAQWVCLFGEEMPEESMVGVEFPVTFTVWVMP